MTDVKPLILGEYCRRLDDRFRLTLPGEMLEMFAPKDGDCILAKERPGCISLWDPVGWKDKLDKRVKMIQDRLEVGDLEQRLPQLQLFGRLLSTRHRPVQLAAKGRLLIPEGFREFLEIESGGELMVVGAAICVEIWKPDKWVSYIGEKMPEFRDIMQELSH